MTKLEKQFIFEGGFLGLLIRKSVGEKRFGFAYVKRFSFMFIIEQEVVRKYKESISCSRLLLCTTIVFRFQ